MRTSADYLTQSIELGIRLAARARANGLSDAQIREAMVTLRAYRQEPVDTERRRLALGRLSEMLPNDTFIDELTESDGEQ
jgi:hypothetical protein